MTLTPKQEKFCFEYLKCGNATEAYRKAYESEKMKTETISRNAFNMLRNTKIATRIDALRAESAKLAVITQAGILAKLIAVSDAAMALDEKGDMKRPEAAIRALELLGKHVGLWPKDGVVQISIGANGSFEDALERVEFVRCAGTISRTEDQLDRLRDDHIGELYSLWRAGKPLPESCTYGAGEYTAEDGTRYDFNLRPIKINPEE